jgi:O-antigen/teichoic acid export membrane protein
MTDASPDDPSSEDAPDYVSRIVKGAGSVFSGSMIGKVVGFILSLVLTRGLGSVRFGLYTLGLTVLRLAQSVSTLGLQNGIVRFGSPSYEEGNTARVKATFLAGGGLGFLAALAIALGLYLAAPWLAASAFNTPEMKPVLRIFACGLPFYVLTYLLSRMARALGRMEVDVLLDSILQPALFLVLVGLVLAFGLGFSTALYAFLLSTILAAGIGTYAIYRLFPPLLSQLRPAFEIRSLLRFSLPIIGVTLASIGLTYTDRFMLGILDTARAVGLYQIAARASEQLRFVLFAVTASFSPIISDLYQRGELEELSALYANTVRWILTTTLPVAVIFVAFAPQIMAIWGPEFRPGAPLLRILAVAHIGMTAVGSVGHMLQMSDHQDFVFAVNMSMAVCNVGLNWLLIELYGAEGAALATGLIQVLGNVLQTIALYVFIGVQPFRRTLWKPLAATGLGALTAWTALTFLPSPSAWMVGIPMVVLMYGAALFGLGLTPTDRAILSGLWSQVRARIV